MDIAYLKGLKVNDNYDQEALKLAILKSYSGNTLLFLGAGFSLDCQNNKKIPIPHASKLSRDICDLGEFEKDDDLAYSADYYLKYNEPSKLIGLLKDRFYINEVKPYHEKIAKINWRRVYTTNYDNCFELSAGKAGKAITPITLEDSPTTYFRSRDTCVHINGSVQLLDNESLEKTFKLSESSYTNSDAFSDSSWSYRFKKDIEICSQIIFIGYSLYDMEVKRLLVSDDNIKRKTIFITKENVSTKEHHRLSAFGEVFPIGVEKFGNLVEKMKPLDLPKGIDYLDSLVKENMSYEDQFVDSDIRDFILRGKTSASYIASSLTANKTPLAIQRKQVAESLKIFNSTNILIIYGALANGKSVLARQVVSSLLLENKLVYTIRDEEANYEKDIELLAELNQQVFLLMDDFERNMDIVRYFSSCLGDNGKLILTERPHRHRRAVNQLEELGLNSYSINVDYLHNSEVSQLANIFSNTGLWGDLGGDSYDKQIKYLSEKCESQLSIILLNLLKAPHVLKKFNTAFSDILKHPKTKKTVYAICLIQHIYPSACRKSFISDIADSNHIYSSEFDSQILESGLFEFKGEQLVTRSSIFSTFILSTLYKASYSIDQMVRIVEKLHRSKTTRAIEENEVYRSIMTFGTLSAILPSENKANSYIQFYEKLKTEIPGTVNSPHYWLQYAMAVMSENKLADTEIILKNAYAKAEKNSDYDTTYIDNQFARLNLKKALEEKNQNISIENFIDGHNILKKAENDIYKFRQAGLYLPYYNEKYVTLSKKNQVKFEHSLKEMTTLFEKFIKNEYLYSDVPPFQANNLLLFQQAIIEIKASRANL
jgi:hypothetical protein